MSYLNLGCGTHFHPAWTNLDIAPADPSVSAYDLRCNVPWSDGTFEVVYHSHLLEHLSRTDAVKLIRECYRVLKPRGILRAVVPDLEEIARRYLAALEQTTAGKTGAETCYDWMMLELYDQTVRTASGGEMGQVLSKPGVQNNEFVRSRMGAELANYRSPRGSFGMGSRRAGLRRVCWFTMLRRWRLALCLHMVALMGGRDVYTAFSEGLFRQSGEVHRWMYDRFSLGRMLAQAGFTDIRQCRADESRIPDFNSYQLDVINGRIRKPDSLFMEAYKP